MQLSNASGMVWYKNDNSLPVYLAVFKQKEYIEQIQRYWKRSGVATGR